MFRFEISWPIQSSAIAAYFYYCRSREEKTLFQVYLIKTFGDRDCEPRDPTVFTYEISNSEFAEGITTVCELLEIMERSAGFEQTVVVRELLLQSSLDVHIDRRKQNFEIII